MSEDEDKHVLAPFLTSRLPQLGLDYETYGPYVLPLLTDEEVDEDEWESVVELLQASSESHGDDEQAWKDLRVQIEEAWRNHKLALDEQEAEFKQNQATRLQEEIEREREIAVEAALMEKDRKEKPAVVEQDAARKALVARFAYDIPDEDDADNEGVLSNKEVAAQAKLEQTQGLRQQKVTTKREEQQKTAKARVDKANAKEERRARATKGERKR
ncbi:predicted protein [Phaeodactylum tricornutum CCAP 1055/1]|jgi:hypothetical protein|uniref:CCDC43 PWI-like domain-containing protein n=2 Tax=Phaeodactylum tricornutum TaxID=2850 RepID=B7G9S2_PHATC|nr:predicted protein [Phaeodactylum tricornutum CCAP 1055/1]EEC44495.1 predicted protein [Phaeodactylum tricornutum CCAP 1055/1]|eukprot:XP_002183826.1 predicted protein [Phaeodactylum tricornutum CCAP 1055/1]